MTAPWPLVGVDVRGPRWPALSNGVRARVARMASGIRVGHRCSVLAFDAPTAPGVYHLLTRSGRLSYVGKAANLQRRLGAHALDGRWSRIAEMRWEVLPSEAAAIAREADVIVALQPAAIVPSATTRSTRS